MRVRLFMERWLDGRKLEESPFYGGEEEVSLGPTRGFVGHVRLDKQLTKRAMRNVVGLEYEQKELLIRLRATWIDDLGEPGDTGHLHWRLDLELEELAALPDPSSISRYFGKLT